MELRAEIRKKLWEYDLSVDLKTGAGCLGILGRSGSGKSMTLKCIAGIKTPDRGSITLDGKTLFDSSKRINLKPQLRKVGYLFQNYALFPNMTVFENVSAGVGKDRDIAASLIKRLRLEGMEKKYPMQLSGGEQQRVALARILACRPEVLLLDEPFSAMDSYLREELRRELKNVLKEYAGLAVLVTHDRDEAYELCDRLLLIGNGKKIAEGDTKSVFSRPGTVEAARLTGCKNLSRAAKAGEHLVKALDWGLELCTAQRVPDGQIAVGVRAHDIMPVSGIETRANMVRIENPRFTELPFEWSIGFGGLLMKTEKCRLKDINELPASAFIPPECILLLEDGS